ncbi:hypothetical protein FACS189461_4080 [Spirochaetia bacterium]|nr:hypothetical protein FACS189461_4080 [Spirochaetia bacterium]
MPIKIALLDSEIAVTHPALKDLSVRQFVCSDTGWTEQPYEPKQGHGTGIASILVKNAENFDIDSFVLLEEKPTVSPERCISILEKIANSAESYDILHMSLGVRQYHKKMEKLCAVLREKGTAIVSAFDNAGAVSFPAAFSTVIGVDASFRCLKNDDFVYVSAQGLAALTVIMFTP